MNRAKMKQRSQQIVIALAMLATLGSASYFGLRAIYKASEGDKVGNEIFDMGTAAENSTTENSSSTIAFTHPDFGFTITYPSNYTLGSFPEGDGDMVLLQDKTSKKGFQVFISAYDEKENLSIEVIRKSLLTMRVSNDKNFTLGTEEIPAIGFDGENAGKETREVWFVIDGNLYQCTSYVEVGAEMEKVLQSITFN